MRKLVIFLATIFMSATFVHWAAFAQRTPAPSEVYDCTQLTEPTQLEECLFAQAGLNNRFVPPLTPEKRRKAPLLKDEGVLDKQLGPPP
jgi:hypothetical protein